MAMYLVSASNILATSISQAVNYPRIQQPASTAVPNILFLLFYQFSITFALWWIQRDSASSIYLFLLWWSKTILVMLKQALISHYHLLFIPSFVINYFLLNGFDWQTQFYNLAFHYVLPFLETLYAWVFSK